MSTRSEIAGEIERTVDESRLDQYIADQLDRVETPDDLVRFFARFTQYNQPFPGGVASLTGAIHVSPKLFVDRGEPIHANADRSSIIASNIMFAAEDEFAGADRSVRITHRLMAQEVLALTAAWAGWTPEQVNEVTDDDSSAAMHEALHAGYRLGEPIVPATLFPALGFHLASERLADIEFGELDAMLQRRFPEFVAHAQAATGQLGFPLYEWVATHTVVETEHFGKALDAAGQAVDWYAGDVPDETLRHWIRAGFDEFVAFQRHMFDNLLGAYAR